RARVLPLFLSTGPPPPPTSTLSLHDALPIFTIEDSPALKRLRRVMSDHVGVIRSREGLKTAIREIAALERENSRMRFHNIVTTADRKSTRLNSCHVKISYAVFCLKKKKTTDH